MSQLTDSTVRDIVRQELSSFSNDIRRDISKLDNRLMELQKLQTDINRTLNEVGQMMGQTRNIASLAGTLAQIQLAMDEVKARAKRAEESSRYTAGYVAMRLKERYERQY